MATRLPARSLRSLLALPLFCAGISAVVADPADYTYRTSSSEVRLTFSATDENDHGVATLQSTDFAVVDKDVIVRNFQSFTRSDWSKLEIAIVVDASGSVTPRFQQELGEVANLVSQTAGIPDENFAIFSFHGQQPTMLCAGNCRASRALERLPERSADGLTPLFDSIVLASGFLGKRGDDHAQKILILFSDGADTISENSMRDAIAASQDVDVEIDCIDLNRRFPASGAAVLQTPGAFDRGPLFRASRRGQPHAANDSRRLASQLHGQLSTTDSCCGISQHPNSSDS
ncbi:MAG TPA: VWA domain-containing protein [Candidatus Sulfotelmatobacter sp.]|nr:VWA domain-containing protein [Candidatus Sulfotelmatobacter sp.]